MISISLTGDGFTLVDRLSFDPCNEGEDLKIQARAYRHRYGHYPKVISANQIYRTRANRAFCQRHGIRLTGPRLGRPKSNPQVLAEEKKQFQMISDNAMPLRARLAKATASLD